MNKNTYHFEHLRLNVSPQTRVYSQANTPGFVNYNDCNDYCQLNGFNYTIVYYDMEGKRHIVTPENVDQYAKK